MKHASFKLQATAVFFALSVGAAAHAQVENYPTKPITIVVPFAPGGGTDVITRIVGQKLSDNLGQPVIVENRAGAGGNIGAEMVAKAKNDGYTLLAGAIVAHAINMTLQKNTIRYNLQNDFAPISYLSTMPVTLVVGNGLPVKSVQQFIDYVKQNPGKVAYASAGAGTTQHLAGEYFQQLTDTKMLHVGYRGSGPAMTDVLSGQVTAAFEVGAVVYPHLKTGKLRPLMVARKERAPALKDVPAAGEVGLQGFEVATIYGLLAPAGTPTPVITRLNKEVEKILAMPEVRQKFEEQGAEPLYTTPKDTAKRIGEEITRWASVVKSAKMKVD